jgi:hypothetical protein
VGAVRIKSAAALVAIGAALVMLAVAARPALASTTQLAMLEDDSHLQADPAGTLAQMHKLGVGIVRVFVRWSAIAPAPNSTHRPKFNAVDPAAYPQQNWGTFDRIVEAAKAEGILVDFEIAGGPPRWADTGHPPRAYINRNFAWYPSASQYGLFVRALGTRYSGTYVPPGTACAAADSETGCALPRVAYWEIWNEPNFGEFLGPQAINGSTLLVAPGSYRALVDAGWSSLQATGHGRDTIVIGGITASGLSGPVSRDAPQGLPGNAAQSKPMLFIRTLYCVDSSFAHLTGATARAAGCPTTSAGYRSFRSRHPGLFDATGFGIHPYQRNLPPTAPVGNDPEFLGFSAIPDLERMLDRFARVYGSSKLLAIYNDEFGYITDPPNKTDPGGTSPGHYISPTTAAEYLNWAEYLSWRNPRIATTMQYLLYDPIRNKRGSDFASGLLSPAGVPKADYAAYRMPLFLPVTNTSPGRALEVWGCVRPAGYAVTQSDSPQYVLIQFQPGSRGPFTTVATVLITNPRGYFDERVTFPSSGTVRLAWAYPNSPVFFSRSQQITIS